MGKTPKERGQSITLRRGRVYLDHSATTPVDSRVVTAMLPYFGEKFGNASSVHSFGQEAKAATDRARREVAGLIGARASEIVFLSGGTEANNLAIRGHCEATASRGRHIITSTIEHPSVRGVCEVLQQNGWEVTKLSVGEDGVISLDELRASLRSDTVLISVMLANNEIGTIQPLAQIGALVREKQSSGQNHLRLHTDAVQAAGNLPLDVEKLGCDLLALSAHKLYAPKGIGALYVRRGVRLVSQNVGGHQERERRGGTEAVPAVVGFGTAARLALEELTERIDHTRRLRNRFESAVLTEINDAVINCAGSPRLPHLSNISFRFLEGEGLLIHLDLEGIAVSTGSACSSGSLEPSPVLRAIGRNDELARGSIRFSFGKGNTEDDVDFALAALARAVARLRELSPLSKTPLENQPATG